MEKKEDITRNEFEMAMLAEAYLERFKSNNSEQKLIAQPSR